MRRVKFDVTCDQSSNLLLDHWR